MKSALPAFALLLLSLLPASAGAETLTVAGLYPAQRGELALVERVDLNSFEGEDGAAFRTAIEDRMRAINLGGQPYFRIVDHRGNIEPQVLMSGFAEARISLFETQEYRNRCVKKDADGKCEETKRIEVTCDKRVIAFSAKVTLDRYRDSFPVYDRQFEDTKEEVLCEDYESFDDPERIVANMVDGAAVQLLGDIAPQYNVRAIRVLENRSGMDKAIKSPFRDAVRLTKTNQSGACAVWMDQAANSTPHVSVLFNAGLCAERKGDLDGAMAWYQLAQRADKRKSAVRSGMARVRQRQQALADWDARMDALGLDLEPRPIAGGAAPADDPTNAEGYIDF